MEMRNKIDELYDLIESSNNPHQTFIDNLDVWRYFYNDRNTFIKVYVLNNKLFAIIKFLLENERGEIAENFHHDLIGELGYYQELVPHQLNNLETRKLIDINTLVSNLNRHNEISEILKNHQFNDSTGEIEKYNSNTLELYTIDAIILLIGIDFFNIAPELVKELLQFITKTIDKIPGIKEKNDESVEELIYNYLIVLIPIKMFIGENIEQDTLIKLIKDQKIKNKEIIIKLFDELPIEIILKIFESQLENIIAFIEQIDYISDAKKNVLTLDLLNKAIEEEFLNAELVSLIMKKGKPKYMDENLWDCIYNKIIIASLNGSILYLDDNMIKFLLTINYKESRLTIPKELSNYEAAKTRFIHECRYLINNPTSYVKKHYDIEVIKSLLYEDGVQEDNKQAINESDTIHEKKSKASSLFTLGKDIDFATSIELLKAYLSNEVELTTLSTKSIIRSIATKMLMELGILNNGVYYCDSIENNGYFDINAIFLTISENRIKEFLNKKNSTFERFKIFITIFHEITHGFYNQKRNYNMWDYKTYEMQKEWIVTDYDVTYYDQNYAEFKEEIEARIKGLDYFSKFMESFLPEFLDEIQDELISELEEEKALREGVDEEPIAFLEIIEEFNFGFDTFVRYNPNILKKHPILNLEYYPNGLPKTYEDIWLSRTEQNKDLIDGILAVRYPQEDGFQINQTHTK